MSYWLSLNQQNISCVSRSQVVSVDHKLFQWIASCFSGSQVFRFLSTTLANSEPYNSIKHLWWSFSMENWCFRVFLFPLQLSMSLFYLRKVYYKAIQIAGINNVPYFANIFDKSTSYFLLGSYVVLPVF